MLDTLKTLLEEQIKDLYNAENQLLKALPKLAKKATSPNLKAAFVGHLEQTREHVERLVEIATMLETKPGGKVCKAMQGLIEEGKEVLEEDGDSAVIDVALIAAAQRVEHYEIAAYTSAQTMAMQLDERKIVEILQSTLEEEEEADDKLSDICNLEILPATGSAVQPSGEPAAPSRRGSR